MAEELFTKPLIHYTLETLVISGLQQRAYHSKLGLSSGPGSNRWRRGWGGSGKRGLFLRHCGTSRSGQFGGGRSCWVWHNSFWSPASFWEENGTCTLSPDSTKFQGSKFSRITIFKNFTEIISQICCLSHIHTTHVMYYGRGTQASSINLPLSARACSCQQCFNSISLGSIPCGFGSLAPVCCLPIILQSVSKILIISQMAEDLQICKIKDRWKFCPFRYCK